MYLAKLFSSFISRDLVEGRELAKKAKNMTRDMQ